MMRKKGQAYTEFVVVLPGVLLLLLLAWEFAYFWWSRMVVSTATFEAARAVAAGEPTAVGYTLYEHIVAGGMGRMAREGRGGFFLSADPSLRSVRARARAPYRWPSGLAALMGGRVNLTLRASAFFRLERFWPGPPGGME
ncbi:MAG: TadE/TadG family type IV pilus assembly protein [Armatimonadota bacterium]|nr:TadE/TadG family type IV pilus assembly protein [Armatimonadota bacterium]